MKYIINNSKIIIVILFIILYNNIINAQVTNHNGQSWTILSNQTATGTHINVGTFSVASGVTLTVSGNELNVEALQINIQGTIDATGKGGVGGTASAGGGIANIAPSCTGGAPGVAGPGGSYTGGGLNGATGVSGGQGYVSGTNPCYYTGGGGGGAGAGGSYGGLGGVGAIGGNAMGFSSPLLLTGGTGGMGGAPAPIYGNLNNQLVDWGSGGGAAGSGGGGYTAGSSGGNGGAGGGKVSLTSCGDLILTGNIYANGNAGGIGGNGGNNSGSTGSNYNCLPTTTTSTCVQSASIFIGAGGGGGGAGGGSGGGILLIASGVMNLTGNLQAKGGAGGDAGLPSTTSGACFNNAQAGGGGGGGRIKIFANSCSNNIITPTVSVAGGAGGSVGVVGNTGNTGTYLNTTYTPTISPGSVDASQIICSGGNPAAFTNSASASLSVCGTPMYQWMECTSGCSNPPLNYTPITGATSDVYDAPPITQTTNYVRKAYIGTCSAYSNILTVTVNPLPADPDTIWVDRNNFCSDDLGNITLTISGGYGTTAAWYTGSCGGTLIATGNPCTIFSPSVTTTYYAMLQTTTCGNSTCSNSVVTVLVKPLPTPPALARVDTSGFCINYSGNITLSTSGGSGDQVAWYTGGCPSSGTSTFIGYGDSLFHTLMLPAPTQITIYYARWETVTCGTTICVSVPVLVNPLPYPSAANNTPVCSGNTINLTSGGGVNYSWSGPSGFVSTLQNPIINTSSLLDTGTYTVTISDVNTCTAIASTNVFVNINTTPLTSAYVNRNNFCTNDTGDIALTGVGGSGVLEAWYVGGCGGILIGTGTTIIIPSPTISKTYFTRWETPSCGNSACKQVTVTVDPMPVPIISSNSPVCQGSIINLNSSGGTVYSWSGPNNFSSAAQNTSILNATLSANGVYTVTVYDASCSAVDSVSVVVNPYSFPTISNNTPICYGDTLELFADTISGIVAYAWNGPNAFHSSAQNPILLNATTTASGTYSVIATNIYGCTNTTSMTLAIPSQLKISLPSNVNFCNGSFINITASASGGTIPYTFYWGDTIPSPPTIQIHPLQDTIYNATVIDNLGCIAQGHVDVFLPDPVELHLYINEDTVCKNSTAIITANVTHGIGAPYMLKLNDGSIVSTPWTITPDSTRFYVITASDGCGFKAIDSIMVTVIPAPDILFISDASEGCQPLVVHFYEQSPYIGQRYFWNFGDGFTDETDTPDPAHIYRTDGKFNVTLTVTSPLGCVNTVTQNNMINVLQSPVATFKPDKDIVSIIDPIITFINSSKNAQFYYWTFGDGESANVTTPTHKYENLGSYEVKLLVETFKGCKDSIVKKVNIIEEYTFFAPNAFSPDNDLKNDTFTVYGNGIDTNFFHMIIYDRWGEIVYETTKYCTNSPTKYGWNGRIKSKGNDPRTNTYTWLVIYKDLQRKENVKSGTVTVIR